MQSHCQDRNHESECDNYLGIYLYTCIRVHVLDKASLAGRHRHLIIILRHTSHQFCKLQKRSHKHGKNRQEMVVSPILLLCRKTFADFLSASAEARCIQLHPDSSSGLAPAFSGLAARSEPRFNAPPGLQNTHQTVHRSGRRRVVSDAHIHHHNQHYLVLRSGSVPLGRQAFHLLRICPNYGAVGTFTH